MPDRDLRDSMLRVCARHARFHAPRLIPREWDADRPLRTWRQPRLASVLPPRDSGFAIRRRPLREAVRAVDGGSRCSSGRQAAMRFNERLSSWKSRGANRLLRKVTGAGGSVEPRDPRWSSMTSMVHRHRRARRRLTGTTARHAIAAHGRFVPFWTERSADGPGVRWRSRALPTSVLDPERPSAPTIRSAADLLQTQTGPRSSRPESTAARLW